LLLACLDLDLVDEWLRRAVGVGAVVLRSRQIRIIAVAREHWNRIAIAPRLRHQHTGVLIERHRVCARTASRAAAEALRPAERRIDATHARQCVLLSGL